MTKVRNFKKIVTLIVAVITLAHAHTKQLRGSDGGITSQRTLKTRSTGSAGNCGIVRTIIKSTASRLLKFLFHSPLAGERVRTLSCLAALQLSGMRPTDTERYGEWFNDDSELTLAQAGTYRGLAEITEYVDFIYSSYFRSTEEIGRFRVLLPGDVATTETNTCSISLAQKVQVSLDEAFYDLPGCLTNLAGVSFTFDLTGDATFFTVKRAAVYLPKSFLTDVFGRVGNDALSRHVCSVMEQRCPGTWKANGFSDKEDQKRRSCEDEFSSLDMTEGEDLWIDGNTRACRLLHGMFAESNPAHCPHISFVPMVDTNGKNKCRTSHRVTERDLFTDTQLSFFRDSAINKMGLGESMSQYTEGACPVA